MRNMNAKSLKLPAGVETAWFWGPLRVVVQYHLNRDAFIARFDSVIDQEEQYNCCFEQALPSDGTMTPRDFGWLCVPFAMKAFREHKITKGHQMAEPIRISFDSF